MIVLKINITNKNNCWTLADLCPCAMRCIEFYDNYFQVELLHTPCFTPVYVNRSHLNKHNKLKYERNSVLEETSRGLKSGYVHIIPHTSC